MAETIRVAVTGAGGQVAYAMLARLASGEVFGPDKKVGGRGGWDVSRCR